MNGGEREADKTAAQPKEQAEPAPTKRTSSFGWRDVPDWMTAVATVGLAMFAFYAWQESQKTTLALQEQIALLRTEQEPVIEVNKIIRPTLTEDDGSVVVHVVFENTGKGPAYDFRVLSFIKVGSELFQPNSNVLGQAKVQGQLIRPHVPIVQTILSRPGIRQDFFTQQLQSHEIAILIDFQYRTSEGGAIKDMKSCYSFETSAIGVVPVADCKTTEDP